MSTHTVPPMGQHRAYLPGAYLLKDDEHALLTHITRFGSDGYPVAKVGSRHWTWSYRSLESKRVYPTKREATASFERYHEFLLDVLVGRMVR